MIAVPDNTIEVSPYAARLALWIAWVQRECGGQRAYFSKHDPAEQFGVSTRTIERQIAELVESAIVERTEDDGYRVLSGECR